MTKATTRTATDVLTEGGIGNPGQIIPSRTKTVHEAWSDVMNQALGLAKGQRYDGGEGGGRFSFRGIDDVMNLVGPILRANRVSIIPAVQSANYRDVTTRGGKTSREVTVVVDYTIVGPDGDTLHGTSCGESLDTGDKGTAKAMSVAYRVFLLQSLCLPTDEPDPDSEVYQRSGRETPEQLAQKTADMVPAAVSVTQLDGVKRWCAERALLDIVVNETEGSAKPLIQIIDAKLELLAMAEGGPDKSASVDRALGGSGE